MGALATVEDYYAYLHREYPPTPALSAEQIADIERGLESATDDVRNALRLARYVRAADGLPLVTAQRDAIPRAVAAQYAAIVAAGGDLTGAEPLYDDVQALGVRFARRQTAAATWTRAQGLCHEARQILRNEGFFSTAVDH